jgi:PleD family two-component response regulator
LGSVPGKDNWSVTEIRQRMTRDLARMTKILLVDDDKFLRRATERALPRAGYQVSRATDGESAVMMARETRPEVILLDICCRR